ncbi:cell envelope integrity protein CreD [Eleftheria terrae]|uniref:cell envelope integrity protein CreD n=1 Tax=Eleftheria terrae TaxID=1597781 RepID=UPI00263BA647|nr:cell envelope integrity protein CreD [Eleftheria terrae]WKB51266.1 cell envelope integrity protein CreD [Eleftheria terrae]
MKHPLLLKALAIVAIFAALLLGLHSVDRLVDERRHRQRQAEQNIEQGSAGRQTVMGPVLHSACVEEWEQTQARDGQAPTVTVERREFRLTAVPSRLNIDASAAPEPRYRGLFKVNAYAAKATVQAQWDSLASLVPRREHPGSRLQCGDPLLMVALSDPRGIRLAQVQVQGQSLAVRAGTFHGSYPGGFHAVLPEALRGESAITAQLQLDLLGTGELSLAPVAGSTRLVLDSGWPHPSFGGRFLPASREVKADGFTATWLVSSLATTAPADFARGAGLCHASAWASPELETATGGRKPGCIESFGVAFMDPVNPYVLSDRAIKYGLLFIVLTFVAVGMVELLQRRRVHPVQYLLVGCALLCFFLLLASLSEHLPFGAAYAAASTGCALLLAYYASHMLGGWRAGVAFGVGTGGLYGALYALLQMEQAALAMGAVLLFAVLAALMIATRKLDWYGLSDSLAAPRAPAA